jgi:tricarballylate dehydrogenase
MKGDEVSATEAPDGGGSFDVAVLGGGNAALCAALSATECGATVAVLESAPRHFRGGNSRHTRNLRCMHDAPTDLLNDAYTENEGDVPRAVEIQRRLG